MLRGQPVFHRYDKVVGRVGQAGADPLVIVNALRHPAASVQEEQDFFRIRLVFLVGPLAGEKNPHRNLMGAVVDLLVDGPVEDLHGVQFFQICQMTGCLYLNPVKGQCF